MTEKRFRVHEWVKYNYSEIGEYTDENHTDKPLMNGEVVELLNELYEENIELHIQNDFLKDENQHMRDLVNENKQLKQFIDDLTTKGTGRIDLANGYSYRVSAILTNCKGDVE